MTSEAIVARREYGLRRSNANLSIGEYLLQRLQDYGIGAVFGIPGDYVLSFYSMLEQSPLRVVGCTREDCAGYAADAYARVNGMGALCITYCVGGLSVCNSVAGAFAEKSPVVVISGAPGLNERKNNPLLHHKVREFHTQLEVFQRLCIAATEVVDPLTAFAEIDRVLDACDRFKRPVYIELPRDMVRIVPPIAHAYRAVEREPDASATLEAAREAVERLNRAQRPIMIVGVEVHRFGLQDQVLQFAEETKIPIAATMLGKSVVGERHPLYVGLYEGALGRSEVTSYVEQSDCILMLGAFMTDINLGIYTANLDIDRCIYATSEQLRISHHHYHDVPLDSFLSALRRSQPRPAVRLIPDSLRTDRAQEGFELLADSPISISRLMKRLDAQLDRDTIVIADVGDALFAATELTTHDRSEFLSPAYYTSMGFGVPASLGALTARPDHRVICLVGDGAFQMTGNELASLARYRLTPIIIILDNEGYGTERYLHPGDWDFNDIHPLNYYRLPEVLGCGAGYLIETEGDFDRALRSAWDDRSQLHILHVKLARDDASETLKRLAARLGERVSGGKTG